MIAAIGAAGALLQYVQDTQRSANDFARGVHLAADGTWLFVQDVKRASHHYLGYSAFDPQYASITPDSTRVAWSTGPMIFVESLDDSSQSVRITAPPTEAYFRAAFVDDDHLVAIDYSGGLHLIDWRKGKELASVDTGGGVREFEVDQDRKLIRGVRQNGGSWVCEMGTNGFKGPYLIQDQGFRSGFLAGEDAVWTLDAQVRYHSYTLAQLRAGLSSKQLQAEGPAMTGPAPMASDARGQRYFVEAQNNSAVLKVKGADDKEVRTMEIPWTPMQTHVSPDGSKLAFVTKTQLNRLWSVPFDARARQTTAEGQPITAAITLACSVGQSSTASPIASFSPYSRLSSNGRQRCSTGYRRPDTVMTGAGPWRDAPEQLGAWERWGVPERRVDVMLDLGRLEAPRAA